MPELAKTMRNHIYNAENEIITHTDEVRELQIFEGPKEAPRATITEAADW